MLICLPDKVLVKWLGKKEYIVPSDEGEAIGIAVGYYLATGKRATVAISADGFCNALNPITSMVIPENVKMNLVISTGRQEQQHIVMSKVLLKMLKILPYDAEKINIKIITG
jgi:phosphonopyruvate decarboxylase